MFIGFVTINGDGTAHGCDMVFDLYRALELEHTRDNPLATIAPPDWEDDDHSTWAEHSLKINMARKNEWARSARAIAGWLFSVLEGHDRGF